MRKTVFGHYVCLWAVMVFAAVSCTTKEQEFANETETSAIPVEHLQIIEDLGLDIPSIVEYDDCYLLERDIRVKKSDVEEYLLEPGTRQYHTGKPVNMDKVRDIKVHISDAIRNDRTPQDWVAAIEQAINGWNSVENSRVQMSITTSTTNADIRIIRETESFLPVWDFGLGTFPLRGLPGDLVVVNFTFAGVNTHLSRVWNVAHELGHNLGFRHTNWYTRGENRDGWNGDSYSAVHIPGTPQNDEIDPLSVFNGGRPGMEWYGFSYSDKVAIRTVYPWSLGR